MYQLFLKRCGMTSRFKGWEGCRRDGAVDGEKMHRWNVTLGKLRVCACFWEHGILMSAMREDLIEPANTCMHQLFSRTVE